MTTPTTPTIIRSAVRSPAAAPPKTFFLAYRNGDKYSLAEIAKVYPEIGKKFVVLNIDLCRKKIKIDNEESRAIFLTFVCKFESDSDGLLKVLPKFFFHMPVFVEFSIITSTYLYYKRLCDAAASKTGEHRLKRLFAEFEIVKYSNGCAPFTNHNFIEKVSVVAKTMDEFKYLEGLPKAGFNIFVDCLLDKNPGLDFFLNQATDIDQVFSFERVSDKVFLYGETGVRSKFVCEDQEVKILEFFVKPYCDVSLPKTKKNDSLYMRACVGFLESICGVVGEAESKEIKETLSYRAGAFDIECGWQFNKRLEEFVTPITGYVQAITTVLDRFSIRTSYLKRNFIVVYVLGAAVKNRAKFEELFLRERNDRFPASAVIRLYFFNDEAGMIFQFLTDTCHLDFLFSYNGRLFDLPFLVHRYNYLKRPMNELEQTYFLNYVSLNTYNRLLNVSSSRIGVMNVKCDACKNDFKYESAKVRDGAIACSKCLHQVLLKTPTSEPKNCTNFGIAKYRDVQIELPLTFHKDLFLIKSLGQDTQDFKLETICNFHFKKKVGGFFCGDVGVKNVLIELSDKCSSVEIRNIASVYFYKAKIVTFSLEQNSNQMIHLDKHRLTRILVSREPADCKRWEAENNLGISCEVFFPQKAKKHCHVYTNFDDTELDRDDLSGSFHCYLYTETVQEPLCGLGQFVSLGKTSEISIEESMIWDSDEVAVNTVLYNIYDSLLTMRIEDLIMSITECALGAVDHLPCFLLFARTPAAKGGFNYIMDLRKGGEQILVSSHDSIPQYKTFFRWPVEVEVKSFYSPAAAGHGKKGDGGGNDGDLVDNDFVRPSQEKIQRLSAEELKTFFQTQRAISDDDFYKFLKIPCMTTIADFFSESPKLVSDEYALNICGSEDFSLRETVEGELAKLLRN